MLNKTLLTVISLCSFSALAEERVLTLFNWQFYLSEQTIERWEQETGARIEQIYFDNDTDRDRTLNKEQQSLIDIAVLDEVASRNFATQGKLSALYDLPEKINYQHIPERWKTQCGTHSVPYLWGTLGLVYRKDQFSTPPDSWANILYPESKHSGHIGMMADYTDMLMPSLFMNNINIDTTNRSELTVAFEELKQQVPHVLTYEYPITFLESNPNNGENLHLVMAYSGDEETMNELSAGRYEWEFVTPKEGTILWVDCLAVLDSSENKDLASHFINFLHEPAIAAQNALELGNNTTNQQAHKILVESQSELLQTSPSESILERSHFYSEMSGVSMTTRSRISNSILKQHKQLTQK